MATIFLLLQYSFMCAPNLAMKVVETLAMCVVKRWWASCQHPKLHTYSTKREQELCPVLFVVRFACGE